MGPFIQAVLSTAVGEESAKEFEIVSSDMKVQPDGTWKIQYRHPTRSFI